MEAAHQSISGGGMAARWVRTVLPIRHRRLNTGDIITCILASSATCATPSSVTSNSLTMTVNPVGKATVGATASPDSLLCVPAHASVYCSTATTQMEAARLHSNGS